MQELYKNRIRPILDCFDKIRDLLRETDIKVPKIVVVGNQSSGKSSVLESISQISLPRGENLVTRCPIIIQLRKALNDIEYARIKYDSDGDETAKQIKLEEIATELPIFQEQLMKGNNMDITDKAIKLEVHRKDAPDLTLYDLPGITYKTDELRNTIDSIITKYSEGEETTCLLVLESTADLTTSEGIALLRKNKDFKSRTIPVLTKIDLATYKKNLYKTIMENELGLSYDPIVVRNRTQDEINENLPMEEVRRLEMNLFQTNEELKKLPEKSKGIGALIDLLLDIQKEKLLGSKDKIKDDIIKDYRNVSNELASMPKKWENIGELRALLYECCTEFDNCLERKCKGLISKSDAKKIKGNKKGEVPLPIPSLIRKKMEELKGHFNKITEKIFEEEYIENTNLRVKNSLGLGLENFFEPECFYTIVKEEMGNLFDKCDDFIIQIAELMNGSLSDPIEIAFKNYSNLKEKIKKFFNEELERRVDVCKKYFKDQKDLECSLIFTMNDNYTKIYNSLDKEVKDNFASYKEACAKNGEYKPKVVNVDLDPKTMAKYVMIIYEKKYGIPTIKVINSLYSYFTVFKNRFLDYFFMKVQKEFFFNIIDRKASDLIKQKFTPTDKADGEYYFMESREIVEKRNKLLKNQKAYQLALEELNKLEN